MLQGKGYEGHRKVRRSSSFNTGRIDRLHFHNQGLEEKRFFLHYGAVTDPTSAANLIETILPDENHNLAAQNHVKVSFEFPHYTASAGVLGTLNFLEAIRQKKLTTRFYRASTSKLYGKVQETPQRETTPFYRRSPYGAAKLYTFLNVKDHREIYGPHAGDGHSLQPRIAAPRRFIRHARESAGRRSH